MFGCIFAHDFTHGAKKPRILVPVVGLEPTRVGRALKVENIKQYGAFSKVASD